MTDVTEELDDLNAKIESEKVSSIMDLAAGVAHELGNPLNSINIHLQVLQRSFDAKGGDAEKLNKSLNSCIKEVQRLDDVIAHFLKAIRPTEPNFKKINTFHNRRNGSFAKEISGKINISMKQAFESLWFREEQLKQVFFNVINALDAVADGTEIRIITGLDEKYVFAQADQGWNSQRGYFASV